MNKLETFIIEFVCHLRSEPLRRRELEGVSVKYTDSTAIILMGKRELVALLNLFSWCLVVVERLFLAVPWGCLQFVIVVFPDHTHLLFSMSFTHHFVK